MRAFFKKLGEILLALAGYMDNDPVKYCEFHKAVGCIHVDGYLCNYPNCDILIDWHFNKSAKGHEMRWLKEICGNCGQIYGSHHGGTSPWPRDYCPDPDERMDWAKGPGTVFKPTGKYKEGK